jgi:chromosome partitioning protein
VDKIMSKMVVCANMKGGVGKTTVAVSMAEASSERGKSVLLIDADLQSNASMTLTAHCPDCDLPWRREQTIVDYLKARNKNIELNPLTFVEQSGGVKLLAGSTSIINFERNLLSSYSVTKAKNLISKWAKDIVLESRRVYDLTICDCPPGLSLLTEVLIEVADLIIVPQIPDRLSTQGLQLYYKYLSEDCGVADLNTRTAVFINMNAFDNIATSYAEEIHRESGTYFEVFRSDYRDLIGFKRAMDRDNRSKPQSYKHVWGPVNHYVEAATNELWNRFLA